MKYSGNKIIDFIKKLISFVKKPIAIMNYLISYGTGMIVLIVLVLFIGVFSALSDDSSHQNVDLMKNIQECIME